MRNMSLVKITIENLGQKEVGVPSPGISALSCFQSARVDWMHSCGGKGRCTTCKMIVIEGQDQLSLESPAELMYERQGQLKSNERLACQAKVWGNIRVRVPGGSKLPHLKYTD